MRFGFGGKTRNDIGAERVMSGRSLRAVSQNAMASSRRWRRFMRFKDQIIAMLQAKMQMRH